MTEIIEIKSLQNDLVKFAVKLQNPKYRKSSGFILADGDKTIEGFIADNIEFEYLFLRPENKIYKKAKAEHVVFVSDEILKKISSLKTPCSMAGIIKEPKIPEDKFYNLSRIALFENIKDAGNLGTVIRSAAAFSIDGIVLYKDCVDLYNTKVIRSAAQNIFKIPVMITSNLDFIKKLKVNHRLISTVVNGKNDFKNYRFPKDFILAFGSEASGLDDEIINISDDKLTLFMDNNVESVNLAVCASIAFYEIKSTLS